MKRLIFILQKEFLQIFRDPAVLRIIFVMPVMQLIVLPLSADFEVKNINLGVVDHDHSTYSQRLIAKFTASGYFQLTAFSPSYQEGLTQIERDRADLLIEIPAHFERDLVRENQSKIFIAVNAINGVKAGLGGGYAATIIRDFNQDVRLEWTPQSSRLSPQSTIEVVSSNWYNRLMSYKVFIVPGILVMLLTMIGGFLSALNIVKEKEIGTIEQINVTPIKKWQFIVGKILPFWILGLIVFTIGLVISRLVYGIIPASSLGLLYLFATTYLVAVMGFGLLISTISDTQQQAMFVSFFFMMIFILMSGLYTPIESMPMWAQWLTHLINPLSYYIQAMRLMVLKGSTFMDLLPQYGAICAFAVVLNTLAILNYRKTS
jgi:ABC-2 type transport system permease protein